MKVVLYARVSTDDKDQDPERQLLKCRQYCELKNHEVIAEYIDYITGDSDLFKRPNGSNVLEKEPDGLVVFSMDRLTRQHPIKVIQFINTLKDRGIKVISITEPAFNMEHEFSEITLFLITWFNNYFLIKLKKDIRSGLDKARKDGKIIGRPSKAFNQYRAYQLLCIEKMSLRAAGRELGINPVTLMRFKKVAEANPDLFINNPDCNKTSD